jgi:transglutaminase-like putative cysteine protease
MLLPAAVGAVLATMLSLSQVFLHQRWLAPSLVATGVAFGVGWVARRLDVPGVLSPALSVLALVALLGLLFHRDATAFGLPTAATLRAIGESFAQAGRDIKEQAPPADPTAALTLLATSGVFAVAAIVDLVVFRVRRPVAAGLPLLALFLVPTSMADKAATWPFVVASAGYLGLLVAEGRDRARGWGRRLSGIDAFDDVTDVSHVARVGRRIGTAAVGIAICVPIAVPSVGRGIFDGSGAGPFGPGKGSSSATVVNPIVKIRDQLLDEDTRALFTVRTDDPQYLRLTTLNTFDGAQWQLDQQNARPSHRLSGDHRIPAPGEISGITTVERHYELSIGSLKVRWLPLPYVPSTVDADGDWRWEATGLAVFSTSDDSEGKHVTATVRLPQPTPDQLRATGPIPAEVQPFLALPDFNPSLATTVVDTVTKGKATAYDKAVALNDYFYAHGGFTYDLNPAVDTSQDPITTFLENKRGFCEQFAGTMAYLARLAGIPARVVVGFTPGSSESGGALLVTNKDAHAWPELYFPHAGWVRFEPTPRSERVIVPGYALPPSTPNQPTTQDPGTPKPSAQPSAGPTGGPKQLDQDVPEPGGDPAAAGRRNAGSVPLVPLALLVVLLGLALPSTVGALTRRRRRSGAVDHLGRIHAAWASLADAAEDTGHPLHAADSPRAAARRLVTEGSLTGDPAAEVSRLAAAEERARYARSAAPVDGLDASVTVVRRALRASLSPVDRVRSTVLPASSLRRIGGGVRGFGERVERARDALGAWASGLLRRRKPRPA